MKTKLTLGQVWTPASIAEHMIGLLKKYGLNKHSNLLDPGCGPATFAKALVDTETIVSKYVAFDIDRTMVSLSRSYLGSTTIKSEVRNADYILDRSCFDSFSAIIMNPPYVRQELLTNKNNYFSILENYYRTTIDKKCNLFGLFLLKSIMDLKNDGILCAIIYDAFEYTLYGKQLNNLLLNHGNILHKESIKTPFNNVLIDAKIILFKKTIVNRKQIISKNLVNSNLVPLGSLANIRRGTCLKSRKIFTFDSESGYDNYAVPYFAKQQSLNGLVVNLNNTHKAFVLEPRSNPPKGLKTYIFKKAKMHGNKLNTVFHKQVRGKILFNYYIRNNARHLFNPKLFVVSDNFYVIKPLNKFPEEVAWLLLNSDEYTNSILKEGRNQGNGLHKLQLYEYKNAMIPNWNKYTKHEVAQLLLKARYFIKNNIDQQTIKLFINGYLKSKNK